MSEQGTGRRVPVRLDAGKFALPAALPAGERVLWQGAPEWRSLARHALHLRALAAYFAVLVGWVGLHAAFRGAGAMEVFEDTGRAALVSSVPLAVGAIYAWLAARAGAYTITNKRVVMRFGLGVPLSLNLPYSQIEAAALSMKADGTGDIALSLVPGHKGLSWFILWPHARPWRMKKPEPMLRGLRDAAVAAQILAGALAESSDVPVVVAKPTGIVDTRDCHHDATAVAA